MNRTPRSVRRPARLLVAVATATVSLTMLTGCGIMDRFTAGEEVPRDEPSGEITAPAEADAFEIALGDCIDLGALDGYGEAAEGDEFEVEVVPVVPCADEHTGEVYAELVMEGDKYPGDKAVSKRFDEWCHDEFETFVGVPFDDSAYSYTGFYPTKDTWRQLGDRTLQCIVTSEEPVTGTLKGVEK
jgi:hypothetical protein